MPASMKAIWTAVLRRVALAAGCILVVLLAQPFANLVSGGVSGFVASALADDGDDDDDDDDDDDRPVRRAPRLELIVVARGPGEIDRVAGQGYQILSRGRLGLINAEVARVLAPRGVSVARARARISSLIPAATVDLNHRYRPDSLPCTEAGCASFEMIAWRSGAAACDIAPRIGIVDTAVDPAHPALKTSNIELVDVRAKGRRASLADHGTAVAALLVGDPDGPAPGLLPRAQLIAADAFHRGSAGSDTADAYDIAGAVAAVIERGAEIVNMSFSGPRNLVLEELLNAARGQGIGLVAAVGHAPPGSGANFPAAFEGVVGVTAIDGDRRLYRRAAKGKQVDFAAPGVSLLTAARGRSGTRLRSGTSFAAPFVTAVLAAARADGERSADEAVAEMARRAIDLGAPGRDDRYGWGLVRAPESCALASR